MTQIGDVEQLMWEMELLYKRREGSQRRFVDVVQDNMDISGEGERESMVISCFLFFFFLVTLLFLLFFSIKKPLSPQCLSVLVCISAACWFILVFLLKFSCVNRFPVGTSV